MESVNCTTGTECKTWETFDDEDQWSEDEAEIPAGVTDTKLTASDFVTDQRRLDSCHVTFFDQ